MPSNPKNLSDDEKRRLLAALVAGSNRNLTLDEIFQRLNLTSRNTTSDEKENIIRTNIG